MTPVIYFKLLLCVFWICERDAQIEAFKTLLMSLRSPSPHLQFLATVEKVQMWSPCLLPQWRKLSSRPGWPRPVTSARKSAKQLCAPVKRLPICIRPTREQISFYIYSWKINWNVHFKTRKHIAFFVPAVGKTQALWSTKVTLCSVEVPLRSRFESVLLWFFSVPGLLRLAGGPVIMDMGLERLPPLFSRGFRCACCSHARATGPAPTRSHKQLLMEERREKQRGVEFTRFGSSRWSL